MSDEVEERAGEQESVIRMHGDLANENESVQDRFIDDYLEMERRYAYGDHIVLHSLQVGRTMVMADRIIGEIAVMSTTTGFDGGQTYYEKMN